MPKGLPSTQDINEGKIKFFSLDTSVIQSAGYKFFNDKLLDLYLQLPYQIKLFFPEVVYKEIISHKENEIRNDIKSLKSSIDKLIRKDILNSDELSISYNELESRYINKINNEVNDYISKFNGCILQIKDCNISELFNSYFKCEPPFENNNEKKHEFPDYVCLSLLEKYALELDQIGIIISNDNGWKKFAEKSNRLYCSNSIDEFTSLFSAREDDISEAILDKLKQEIEKSNSYLHSEILDQIDYVNWFPDVYSENMYSCDAEVISYDVRDLSIKDYDIWRVERESASWVVKIDAKFDISLSLEVESFIKDGVDKELISVGFQDVEIDIEPEFEFHIICSNVEIDSECNNWDIEVKILDDFYNLDQVGVYHSYE